jgi:iron complex outermembrane receptor protein
MDRLRASPRLATAVALALGATGFGTTAYAADTQVNALEDIVVTARKREENLQDLGASVSALGANELNRRFDVDLASFANAAPNVVIDDLQQGPGSPAAISIRGIGTTDVEKSFDPTAGVVLDGVFIGANSGAMIKALDLQSMEILRGPQGTLFGRNSIAGAINVTRRKPGGEGGGEVRLGIGNYSDFQADGYVNGNLTDNFAVKLAGAKRKRDGWFENRTLGKDVGELDYYAVSPSFLWTPTENLEFYYRYDRSKQTQDANTVHNMAQADQVFCFFYNQCAQGLQTPQSGDRLTVLQNGDGRNSFFESDLHIFQAKWEFAPTYQLDYIFGYFKTNEEVLQDWDGTPLTLYHTERPAVYQQRSHELRLTHAGEGALSYTVGFYGWNSGYTIDLLSFIGFGDFLFGLPSGTVLNVPQSVRQRTESQAVFFEGDYKFTDALTLTLGGRYTKDEKESGVIDPLFTAQLAVLGGFDNPFNKEWSEFTPKVSLRYRVNDDLMVYGLYSRGFRAGGFSGRPGTYEAAATPYDPETVDNFEAGIKSEWFDKRLRLNASVYFMKYEEKQEELSVPVDVAGGTGQQTLVLNAATADLKGVELELQARPGGGFAVNASLGYLDAEYKDFVDPLSGQDISYLKLRRAPKVTASLSPSYEWEAMDGTFWVQATAHYSSSVEYTFFNTPQARNPSQTIVDASINYQRGKTMVSLWGMNLGDEDGWSQAYDVGSSLAFPGLWTYAATRPPRTYGLRIQQSF